MSTPNGRNSNSAAAAPPSFFEVDAEYTALAALVQPAHRGLIEPNLVEQAIHRLGVDPEKVRPMRA